MPITINGTGTITGISAGGLPDLCITTDDLAANAVTTAKMGTSEASGLAKAWVNFNGTGTVAIRANYNVSSITDNGTGYYTVNFTTALADGNYAVSGIGRLDGSSDHRVPDIGIRRGSTPSTTSVEIQCTEGQITAFDCDFVTIAIFR